MLELFIWYFKKVENKVSKSRLKPNWRGPKVPRLNIKTSFLTRKIKENIVKRRRESLKGYSRTIIPTFKDQPQDKAYPQRIQNRQPKLILFVKQTMKSGHSIIQNSQCPSANQKITTFVRKRKATHCQDKTMDYRSRKAEMMELTYLGHLKSKYIKSVLNKVFNNLFVNVT